MSRVRISLDGNSLHNDSIGLYSGLFASSRGQPSASCAPPKRWLPPTRYSLVVSPPEGKMVGNCRTFPESPPFGVEIRPTPSFSTSSMRTIA